VRWTCCCAEFRLVYAPCFLATFAVNTLIAENVIKKINHVLVLGNLIGKFSSRTSTISTTLH
jgi:hypothetical protein